VPQLGSFAGMADVQRAISVDASDTVEIGCDHITRRNTPKLSCRSAS
jgi:hypothetical protein